MLPPNTSGRWKECSSVGTKKNTSLVLLPPPPVPDPHQLTHPPAHPLFLWQAEEQEGVDVPGEVWAHMWVPMSGVRVDTGVHVDVSVHVPTLDM